MIKFYCSIIYAFRDGKSPLFFGTWRHNVKACISDDNLFTNPPSVRKVYKGIKRVYGSWSSPYAVRSVKQHEESGVSRGARRDERYFRGCLENKTGRGIKWISRVRRTETQWKYLSSIERVLSGQVSPILCPTKEIKSEYRAASSCSRLKGQEYVCALYFALVDEPRGLYKRERGRKIWRAAKNVLVLATRI